MLSCLKATIISAVTIIGIIIGAIIIGAILDGALGGVILYRVFGVMPGLSKISLMTATGLIVEMALIGAFIMMVASNYLTNNKKDGVLPENSIRALLAIFLVGSYFTFIIFGYSFIVDVFEMTTGTTSATTAIANNTAMITNDTAVDNALKLYQAVISGASGLVGAVVGFYFGDTRTSSENGK